MCRLLVFDLDDTLYPEREFVLSGFRAAAEWLRERHGESDFHEQACRLFEGGMRGQIFDAALREAGWRGEAPDAGVTVPALVEAYRSHAPQIRLFEDASWALEYFGARGALGLLTDGFAVTQRNKIAALEIAERFRGIVCSDELGRENWKPSPAPFRRLMADTGFEGGDCVYVADNPRKDFVAARALGWKTIRIRRHGGEYSALVPEEGYGADHDIESLHDLAQLL